MKSLKITLTASLAIALLVPVSSTLAGAETTETGVELRQSEARLREQSDTAIQNGQELRALRAIFPNELSPAQLQRLRELTEQQQQLMQAFREVVDSPEVQAQVEARPRPALSIPLNNLTRV